MLDFEDTLANLLPAFLKGQRWFGGKAKTIAGCEIADVADVAPGQDVLLVVAVVAYADGARERYGLVVTPRAEAGDLPALGRITPPDSRWIVEGTGDAAASGALLGGFLGGGSIPTRRGGRLVFADVSESARRHMTTERLRPVPLGAEQSNTSLRVGPFVFKLFRRLEPGENPELEVGRFLTQRTGFRAISTLDGSLTYVPPDGEWATLGILQTWVANHGDGWTHVVSALVEYLRGGASPSALVRDIALLGRITAECHAALGSDRTVEAFTPEPVQPGDLEAWALDVRRRAARVFGMVESHLAAWPDDTRQLGASVVAHAASIAPAVASIVNGPGAFDKIRIHGDYHLGQTLRTSTGFVIIDFEGEPARPLRERRQKQCALKDVAGMLRSFDYAMQTAVERAGDSAAALGQPPLREAFIEGYLQTAISSRASSLPPDRGAIERSLAFFELEKALYELEYEINNRPAWVHIPLRGVLRILTQPTV